MVDRMVLKSFSGPIVTELDARAFLVNAFGKLDVSDWTEEHKAEVLDDQLLLHAMARQNQPKQSDLDQQLSDYRLNGVDEAEDTRVEEDSEEASEDCAVDQRHIVTGSATSSVAGTMGTRQEEGDMLVISAIREHCAKESGATQPGYNSPGCQVHPSRATSFVGAGSKTEMTKKRKNDAGSPKPSHEAKACRYTDFRLYRQSASSSSCSGTQPLSQGGQRAPTKAPPPQVTPKMPPHTLRSTPEGGKFESAPWHKRSVPIVIYEQEDEDVDYDQLS